MDAIRLRASAYGRHGADPGERERRQLIEIDLTAEIDLEAAQRSDDLSETLDYSSLQKRLVRIVATSSYALLEGLGGELLEAVFSDRRVKRAEVTLSKPEILGGATASITLRRSNPRYESV